MFLPSVLIIAGIACITFLYLNKVMEYVGCYERKAIWLFKLPFTYILCPTFEELVFRAPLIIAFGALSPSAWYGIIVSSILFSLCHWDFRKKISPSDISDAFRSDNHEKKLERLLKERGIGIIWRHIIHCVLALSAGVLMGYYGIKYQSIWVSVGIHAVLNLVAPIVFTLLFLLVAVIIALLRNILLKRVIKKMVKVYWRKREQYI